MASWLVLVVGGWRLQSWKAESVDAGVGRSVQFGGDLAAWGTPVGDVMGQANGRKDILCTLCAEAQLNQFLAPNSEVQVE